MTKNRIGLALSGGGYRAAAFHLGTLRALSKLGVLAKIDVLSTISGGSITGAAWILSTDAFQVFEEKMIKTLSSKSVIRFIFTSRTFLIFAGIILLFLSGAFYLLLFTGYPWLSTLVITVMLYIAVRFQFILFPVSKEIERAYDKFFFSQATLKNLPAKPEIAIGSTNLLSTTPFTFSRRQMGDSYYDHLEVPIHFMHEYFPVSRAVVASSCVPFAFTPVTIGKEFYVNPDDFAKTDTKLVDGGVFDNQGIHKLTFDKSSWFCNIVLVSDAGNKLPFKQSFNNTIVLLIRTVDVFMDRIKGFQIAQNLYRRDSDSAREIAYISLGWDFDRCISGFVRNMISNQIPRHIIDHHQFEAAWIAEPGKYVTQITNHLIERTGYKSKMGDSSYNDAVALARNVGTNLTKLSPAEINGLIIHAEYLTELQVKLYCPGLMHDALSGLSR